METFGCGILDSGCSKNVCGLEWMEAYINTLSEDQLKSIKYEDSDAKFKFGNPTIYKSIHKVTFPANIGSKKIYITTDVIDVDIPTINFKDDIVTMFGETIRVRFSSTGHYCICLNRIVDVAYDENVVTRVYFVNLEKMNSMTMEDKERVAIKVHKQFCHASGSRLKILMVNAGVQDKEMLKTIECIEKNCNICIRYKKVSPKPIVTLPVAKIFNEHVAQGGGGGPRK